MPITDACGAEAGAARHYRAGEKPCPRCREAMRIADRERSRRRRDPTARERVERIRHENTVAGLEAYMARRRHRLRDTEETAR